MKTNMEYNKEILMTIIDVSDEQCSTSIFDSKETDDKGKTY